jgi:hypothetical protein
MAMLCYTIKTCLKEKQNDRFQEKEKLIGHTPAALRVSILHIHVASSGGGHLGPSYDAYAQLARVNLRRPTIQVSNTMRGGITIQLILYLLP